MACARPLKYIQSLLRSLVLTTLETRSLRADMVQVYNILIGFEGTDVVTFFQRRVGYTRGNDWEIVLKAS